MGQCRHGHWTFRRTLVSLESLVIWRFPGIWAFGPRHPKGTASGQLPEARSARLRRAQVRTQQRANREQGVEGLIPPWR